MDSRELWQDVMNLVVTEPLLLSKYTSHNIIEDFKRFVFSASRYKFAAKLLSNKKTLLDIGCQDGFMTQLFKEQMERVVGIDFDKESIEYAKKTFENDKFKFIHDDFFDINIIDKFDAVISMDVIEHIPIEKEENFLSKICKLLDKNGIAIIGTPNIEASKYQSEASKRGHINLYSHDRLLNLMNNYFNNVFLFSSNDEIVHTGYYSMAHYFIVVGISPKN